MNRIEVNGISKKYKNHRVIKSMSFTVGENEIVALLGKNGAGKSTLIRMLLGILTPDEGIIRYWRPDFHQKIGVQLQSTPFYENLNIIDNMLVFAALYHVRLSKERIEALLHSYGLYDVRKTNASGLYLGQQKRLAILITTLHNPDLVILDEPSSGLDPRGQRGVRKMILQLKKEGKSVLFSSHDMIEIQHTADRIILLHEGTVMAAGHPAALMEEYHVPNLEELFFLLTEEEVYDD